MTSQARRAIPRGTPVRCPRCQTEFYVLSEGPPTAFMNGQFATEKSLGYPADELRAPRSFHDFTLVIADWLARLKAAASRTTKSAMKLVEQGQSDLTTCPDCGHKVSKLALAFMCPRCGGMIGSAIQRNQALRFRNPSNGYTEKVSGFAWLWTLLFGGFYFAVKGVWTHAIVGLLIVAPTFGISWLVYPFFARSIMRTHYLRKGWIEVG